MCFHDVRDFNPLQLWNKKIGKILDPNEEQRNQNNDDVSKVWLSIFSIDFCAVRGLKELREERIY